MRTIFKNDKKIKLLVGFKWLFRIIPHMKPYLLIQKIISLWYKIGSLVTPYLKIF